MAEPSTTARQPKLRWYQYRLRSLLLGVTLLAVIASLVSTAVWWRTRHPSRSNTWSNDSCQMAGRVPHFVVWAKAINGEMPTIACFARIDDPNRVNDPIRWLKCDIHDQVFIEGCYIPHRAGILKLFVDDGSGHPTLVILDGDDASRYFDRDNTYFTTDQAFVDFWENVLEKKYLRGPNKSPTPPTR